MDHKKQILENLLGSLKIIKKAKFPLSKLLNPFGQSETRKQFIAWIGQVSASLEAAGMKQELDIWRKAYSPIPNPVADSLDLLNIHIGSSRAILTGFLENLDEGPSDELFPVELVESTRGYIESIAIQANGCYQKGWYDACAVMLRRLIETLIIECFEHHGIADKIKDTDGNYFYLADLIRAFLSEKTWHIPRNMGKHLGKLKTIGDSSAHDRYFVAKRGDVEKLSDDVRFTIQSLIYIAKFD
jgi:hypothetical protein